ncbi:hypothetical protein [Yoonia sp.]|uniref:hypothetical protein n=1 Tax=Yoonia sp. TaxID=2212373 RepID=UPI0019E0670B|nr:hypothetical protein [Yoonia sp.]MBE0414478.1 hypothetical protein [Yoonia sp.]
MKNRWHISLQAAVDEFDTALPWERGASRKAMIARRNIMTDHASKDNHAPA